MEIKTASAHIDLRLLRYFIAVADEGHLTRIAERLGISQLPLSQQIRVLEEALGVTLFHRLPRVMELTESGRAFLADARAILARLGQAVDDVCRVERGESGRLIAGFTGSAALHPFVPSVINAFREAAPGVSLALEESGTAELIEDLRADRIDVAFIRAYAGSPEGVASELLLEEKMLAVLPARHPLAKKRRDRPLGLAELADESFILYQRPSGAGIYDAVIAACRAAGFSPHVDQEAPRMLSTPSLVASGLGVTIVPASIQRVNVEGISYVELDTLGLSAPLYLVYRKAGRSEAV
ncbi:MAG: LysR family transcriptional regulator [Candidatus Protistobacter heckmanni]|nr:LysR family transcriptional regulator [Candidatus Protistobacter heckmanni]